MSCYSEKSALLSYITKLEAVYDAAKEWRAWRERNSILSRAAHEGYLLETLRELDEEGVADGQMSLQIDDSEPCTQGC
jgi:hypothetical protein